MRFMKAKRKSPHINKLILYPYIYLQGTTHTHSYTMAPTAKEILFSRTFPGQNYHFQGQSIQELKVIYRELCEKVYNIYSMYD